MDTRHIDLLINQQENEMKLFIFYIFLISAIAYSVNVINLITTGEPNVIMFVGTLIVYSITISIFTKFVVRRAGAIKPPSVAHYTSLFTIIGILFVELFRIYKTSDINVEHLKFTISLFCVIFAVMNYFSIISTFNNYIKESHSGK